MSSEVTRRLRQARLPDAEALAEIEVTSWQQAYVGILPGDFLSQLSRGKCFARWLRRLMNPKPGSERIWVVELGGELVGYAQSERCRDRGASPATAELTTLYLAPKAWGLGVGRALLDMVILDAEHRGAREIMLWVLEANTRARRFYKKAGFTPDARKVEHGYGAKLPQIRYRKKIG